MSNIQINKIKCSENLLLSQSYFKKRINNKLKVNEKNLNKEKRCYKNKSSSVENLDRRFNKRFNKIVQNFIK